MNKEEEWPLGSATASIKRGRAGTKIELSGIVTPQVFEAVHLRMAREPAGMRRILMLGNQALLALTYQSAVEAALRGTPISHTGACRSIFIAVPPSRVPWALQHCALMSAYGLSRVTLVRRHQKVAAAAGNGEGLVALAKSSARQRSVASQRP